MISCLWAGHYGRLGNAMFQYAALVGASHKTGHECVFDYQNPGSLGSYFNLSIPTNMSREEINQNIHNVYDQPKFCYDQSFEEIEDSTDIRGYFQSSKFFEGVEDEIRKEFTPIDEVIDSCSTIESSLREKSGGKRLVSIHVRRGDYMMLKDHHPPCEVSYYKNAISQFDINNSVFVVFSDDMNWCKKVFEENVIYVDGGAPVQDMYMMSKCDDNIIANSSFSWWGAWLNSNQDRKVVAPSVWFGPAKDPAEHPMHDLYEEGWIVV
tara:strand:+ start:453 stop:1250 length:798 start_codon:yes stop_codon:yes gene_type:complete